MMNRLLSCRVNMSSLADDFVRGFSSVAVVDTIGVEYPFLAARQDCRKSLTHRTSTSFRTVRFKTAK